MGGDVSALRAFDFALRLLVVPFAAAAVWIAVTAHQNNADYGKLGFGNFAGLKYMVCISAVSGGYALFGVASSYLRCLPTKTWLFFVADQILAYLMVTSMAAQGEFLYLAYKGDQLVSWSEACGSYGKFCIRLRTVLVLHAIAVCCFLALAVISAYRVFSRFDPPLVATKEGELNTDGCS